MNHVQDHTACNPCHCNTEVQPRSFCDNCCNDFQDLILDCTIWGEKVFLCSSLCMTQLERVWAPKKTSVVRTTYKTRPYTPGRTSKETILTPCHCGVWHKEQSYQHILCAVSTFFPAYLFSLGVSLVCLFMYSAVSAG